MKSVISEVRAMRGISYFDLLQRKKMLSQNGSQILKPCMVMAQIFLLFQMIRPHLRTCSLLERSADFSENRVLRILLPRRIQHSQNNQILVLNRNSIVSSSRLLLSGNGLLRFFAGFSELQISNQKLSRQILLTFLHSLFLLVVVSVDFLDYYNSSRASSSLIRIKTMFRIMLRKIKIHSLSILLLLVR